MRACHFYAKFRQNITLVDLFIFFYFYSKFHPRHVIIPNTLKTSVLILHVNHDSNFLGI